VAIRERTSLTNEQYRFQGNAYLEAVILPGLIFKTSNGVFYSMREYNKKEQSSAFTVGTPNKLTRSFYGRVDLLSENTLNYSKKIENHDISALMGFTLQKVNNRFNSIVATDFPDELMLSFNLASQLILNSASSAGTTSFYDSDALFSVIGRLNYAYKDKYLASASFRADGSSKFYTGNKWGSFPAMSLGWRLTEEDFLKSSEWLSNLKLRLSYGLTGNNSIPQYSYMNKINTNNYVLGTGNGSLTQGMASNDQSLGNPDITWEQTEATNFGFDFGVFNNRFNLAVDMYNSNTIQLLLEQPSMATTGHSYYWNNIGKINNKGIELELTTLNIKDKNFTWKTTANLSVNKNILVNYGGKEIEYNFGERNEVYSGIVGQSAVQYYGYKSDGIWTTFEEVEYAKKQTDENGELFTYTKFSPIVGGLKVKNLNNDNKIDADDRTVLGSPFPDYTWGVTNAFVYKDFDVSFMWQGVQGVDIINGNIVYNDQLYYNKAYIENRYVSPMFPGDGKTVYATTTAGTDLILTDYAIEDGSFSTLRDFSIGYKLPNSLVKQLKVQGVRTYFSAQNLIYIMASNYRGINPEARNKSGAYRSPMIDGYQRGVYPLNRTFTFGIDISF
jgi:TonB-linked SusC/RagA family outer membrane protein